jgi:hypothetical protein
MRAVNSNDSSRIWIDPLPDHSFQSLTINFCFTAFSGVGEIEAAKASVINQKTAGPISKIRSHVFCAIEDFTPQPT